MDIRLNKTVRKSSAMSYCAFVNVRLFQAIIIAFSFCGCAGSITTRSNGGAYSFVGGYPYMAVVTDFKDIVKPKEYIPGPVALPVGGNWTRMWAFFSIPLDIVIDSTLLVPDLVMWPWGYKKYDDRSSREYGDSHN